MYLVASACQGRVLLGVIYMLGIKKLIVPQMY